MNDITERQYKELAADVETAKAAAERAKGALETTAAALNSEFNVTSIKQAKDKLTTLKLQAAVAKSNFEKAFKAYDKKWNRDDDDR